MGSVTTSPGFAQYSRKGLGVGSWRGELELEGEGFISRRGEMRRRSNASKGRFGDSRTRRVRKHPREAESAEGFWSWGSTPVYLPKLAKAGPRMRANRSLRFSAAEHQAER